MGGNFWGGNSPEGMGIFLEPFSSYNISILIFQEDYQQIYDFQQKDRYSKLIKCRAKFSFRTFLFQWV